MIQEFKINNTKDVESFLHYLVNPQGLNLGMSFHPDDTFEDYIKGVIKLIINKSNSIIQPEKIVLLCYEAPETFCHRLILTTYLDMVMGYKILELGHDNVFQCEDAKIIRIVLTKLEQYTKGEQTK